MPAILVILLALQGAPACPDAPTCRTEAEAAASRGDYEAFHDLAWRAVQKGKPNDPALLFVLARAQSLSGRYGDALVMLDRLAGMHAPLDLTLPDFDRTRRLPEWAALEAKLAGLPPPAAEPRPSPAVEPAPAPVATASVPAAAPASAPLDSADALSFDAPANLGAFALAHDAVSRRFVVGDAPSRRLFVVDEVSKHVVPYVSAASAGFYDDLTAMVVDARRGDLWVASAKGGDGGTTSIVHKLQLVSGRGLMDVRPPDALSSVRIVDLAVAADGTVIALDVAGGRLLRLRPGSRALEAVTHVDASDLRALTLADDHVAFVATGTGVVRVDLSSRTTQAVKGVDDLSGFVSLAFRNGALVGVQHAAGASLVVRVALDAAGTRAQPRAILAASSSPIVGSLADSRFYYLVDGVIKRVVLR